MSGSSRKHPSFHVTDLERSPSSRNLPLVRAVRCGPGTAFHARRPTTTSAPYVWVSCAKKIATLRHTPNNRVPNSKCQERRRQTPGKQRIHVRTPEIDNRQSSGNREGNLTKVEGNECAAGTSMAPGETALFQCQPALREGSYSQVVLGRPIHSAVMTEINTALSPIGIASADIVMSEGGPGEGSITCEVNLENIVRFRRQPPGLDTLGSPSGLEDKDDKQAIRSVLSPLSPTGETHGHSTQFHQ